MKNAILLLALVSAVTVTMAGEPVSPVQQVAGWRKMSNKIGVHDHQVIVAPHCGAGSYAIAEVSPEKPVGAPIAFDTEYALSKENVGWRLDIVRADTGKRAPDAKRLTATVTTYCAS